MQSRRLTLKKSERLTHKTVIGNLFANGNSFTCYPFRIVWNAVDLKTPSPAQIAVTVSKRNFKLAVTRNLLKRRIREIYRLNKPDFYSKLQQKDIQIAFMVVYMSKKVLTTKEMTTQLKQAIERIPKEYDKLMKREKTE